MAKLGRKVEDLEDVRFVMSVLKEVGSLADPKRFEKFSRSVCRCDFFRVFLFYLSTLLTANAESQTSFRACFFMCILASTSTWMNLVSTLSILISFCTIWQSAHLLGLQMYNRMVMRMAFLMGNAQWLRDLLADHMKGCIQDCRRSPMSLHALTHTIIAGA